MGKLEKNIVVTEKNLESKIKAHKQTEKQLIERSKQLEVSNKELESYSYSIAHDLRTPLRSVTSFSQILSSDASQRLSSQENDSLQRIISAGKHMANLIDDILELSRIARSDIKYSEVDLSKLAKSCVDRVCDSEKTYNINWKIQENITAFGDTKLLSVMMENLLGNACKYTSTTENAEIEFGMTTNHGLNAYFVRDNGIGFNMDHAKKLFHPFQRLHGNNNIKGTGIGLATVQRIIERHNGSIWFEAEEGKGAVFYFVINTSAPIAKYNHAS